MSTDSAPCLFCSGSACAHCGSSPMAVAWCDHDTHDRHAQEECTSVPT